MNADIFYLFTLITQRTSNSTTIDRNGLDWICKGEVKFALRGKNHEIIKFPFDFSVGSI